MQISKSSLIARLWLGCISWILTDYHHKKFDSETNWGFWATVDRTLCYPLSWLCILIRRNNRALLQLPTNISKQHIHLLKI